MKNAYDFESKSLSKFTHIKAYIYPICCYTNQDNKANNVRHSYHKKLVISPFALLNIHLLLKQCYEGPLYNVLSTGKDQD